MKSLFIRYFLLLLCLFAWGAMAHGEEAGGSIVVDKSDLISSSADETFLSVGDQFFHSTIERRTSFSQQESSSRGSQYSTSYSFFRNISAVSRDFVSYRQSITLHKNYYNSLLSIRHIHHFYIYNFCKIII